MSDIDLTKFEKKIIVRPIKQSDFDEIIALQKLCFPKMIPWKISQLQSQLETFPAGQLCVEYDGKIIGSSSSLIVTFDEYDDQHSWDEITDQGYITNHDPEGSNLYGMEVMTHPDFRNMKVGKRLYDARKELVQELNLESIVIGGRIPNYYQYANELTPKKYAEEVIMHNIYDPILTFQIHNGFVLKRIIKKYLPEDKASLEYATLMEWNNIEYSPPSKRHFKTAFPVRICVVNI